MMQTPSTSPREEQNISNTIESVLTNRYNINTHARLIAKFLNVQKLPHAAFVSTRFHALQNYYCISVHVVEDSGLVMTVQKLPNLILPQRAETSTT